MALVTAPGTADEYTQSILDRINKLAETGAILNTSTALTTDVSTGAQIYTYVLNTSGAISSWTLSNPTDRQILRLLVSRSAAQTVVWPTNIEWASSTAPDLNQASTKYLYVELHYRSSTSKWYEVSSTDSIPRQPLDADLTAIAGLTATTNNMIMSVSSAWASRTPAQVKTALAIAESDVTNLVTDLAAKQPLDTDLTTIAGLTATTDNILQSVGSAWASRTPAQVKATLALAKADVGLGNVDNTSNATERAAAATLTNKTLTAPAITSPTGIVKGDVGLGNVDNTSNATERAAAATLTNKRVTKRVVNTTSTATLTVDSDANDIAELTAQAAGLTIAAPTGTPTAGQSLIFRFKDNGTARALTWNAAFRAVGVTLPTTTVLSKTIYIGCIWNVADSKWDVIAVAQEA